jgi:hypothetical protein
MFKRKDKCEVCSKDGVWSYRFGKALCNYHKAEGKMSKRWWLWLPGDGINAVDYVFRVAVSEREARTYMRKQLGVKRLPNGTQVWKGA